uniref:non-specific serine/threonine protein kinase n=1 Tax=Naja naja TaxID=35670 RepID=A0A8C7E4M8_NAJNA
MKKIIGTTVFCKRETFPTIENHYKNTNCLKEGEKMEINNGPALRRNDNFIPSTTRSVCSLFIYDAGEECWNSIEGKVDGFDSSQVDSTLASQISECTDSCCFNAKVLTACQTTEYAKTCEKGSPSKVLEEDTPSENQTRVPLEDKLAENSSFTVDSGTQPHLDGKFIEATEGFQNDFLEDTESSDVIREEIYEDWEAKLKFLLESDEEEDELIPSTDCDGCSYFLNEMPRLFQVSDNTMPMETTIGFSRHPSKSREVAVRSNVTACRPSTLQTGMTLTVGQQQSLDPGMKKKEKQKQPVIKNNYSRTGEENCSHSCSGGHVAALRSQGIENGTSAMKSPSRHLDVSSATPGKEDTAERKNSLGEIKSQRVIQVGKKTMREKPSLPRSSEDPLKALPPNPLCNSKLHTTQVDRNHLGSATSLHRQRKTTLGLTNVANKDAFFHGQGSQQRDRLIGKWITGPSKGSQAPEEKAIPKTEQQEIDAETSASISNDEELFITDPTVDKKLVLTPSHGAAKNSALPKVHRKTGFQTGNVTLENSVALGGRGGTHEAEEQKPGWNQIPHLPMVDNRASCDCPNALCEIPMSMLDVQMEEARAGKPLELNRIKILHDIPRTGHPSKENFQSILESTELKDRDAGVSTMCELSKRLLYENDDWDDDFSCTSREVKRVAAETASAKGVRGLNITADVSGRQHVPENLTEDNQHVSELTTEMKGLTDFSLVKTDGTYSHTSKVNSMTLPVEPDSIDLCSVFQHKREKPSVYFIRSDLQERKYPNKQCEAQHVHHGSIQKSVYHEDTVLTEKAFQCCEQEPTYRFGDSPDDPLESSQEFLLKQLPNNLGQFSYTEQKVNWESGHIAKQANEVPLKEHQSPVNQSRINDCPLKEDSSRNFCGKIMAPLLSRKQTSVMAINRSAKQENQGKESRSELNAKRNRSCGIYHNKSNNRDFKAVPDAQNHIYHIPESNSLMSTEPKNDWQALETTSQENKGRDALKPIFTASYKVRFFTEVLLEINKSVKTSASQNCTDCVASLKPTLLESLHVSKLPPHDSQQLVSEKNSAPAKHLDESMKSLGLDLVCSPFEMNTSAGSNTVQSSTITSSEDYGIRQKTQNDGIGNLTLHGQDISNLKRASESCNADILALSEHVGQTQSIQSQMVSSMDAKAMTSGKDKYKGTEENQNEEITQSEKEKDMLVAPDFEEAEIDPYVRVLLDSEQGHPVMVSHGEYQKMERQSQSKIMPDEMDTKETEKLVEDDLEEVEVEPYMRALLDSEPMYSWHEYSDCMPPFMEFCNEQAAVLAGRLESGCTVTTTDPNQSRAFTDGKRQNSSERGMRILESPLPCASEDNCHSEKALPLDQTQPCTLGTNEGGNSALENERTISLEASEISKPLSPHKSADTMKNGLETTMMSKVPKKPCLETKENICNDASWRTEASSREEKREEQRMLCKKDNKAPKLLRKIHAELFPDFSGNIKLCCQFGEIHSDSTITWTKDSKLLARVHRSARDDLPVSLAIVQAGKKDQGLYHCCLKNIHGKAVSEFNLTSEVLEHLSSLQDAEGLEEIEFLQLKFREDFICDSYLSKSLHGRITTEELHFGEGVHRKAFRSKVLQGLVPPLSPGHPCVLKVHNAIVYGTKNNDELVEKNYKLSLQECYVQNTAREYAKIYAAETQPLEGFGEVPEIIPIFLIHRPQNNIPYATVEEELIGEFVKYSVKDGKEINFMRKDSEAGQKCCTFQHWVYEKTSGSLLVTDMQGVGMKLTDVGIATPAKGTSSAFVTECCGCP